MICKFLAGKKTLTIKNKYNFMISSRIVAKSNMNENFILHTYIYF